MGELAAEEHVKYIISVEKRKDDFQSVMMEHIRMIGAYWGLTTLDILGKLDTVDIDEVVSWVLKCQHESEILVRLDLGFKVFLYCNILSVIITLTGKNQRREGCELHCLLQKYRGWIWMHAWWRISLWTEIFLAGGYVSGKSNLEVLMVDLRNFLMWVCYSWWVLSSLIMIDRVHWINKEKLIKFILDCQGTENGGISDRPDDAVDIYHSYFGIAGLSLLETWVRTSLLRYPE
ncbi:unnamed protein product [Citrullus colocynthis]|uniref:Geranylgeranyl transferase type II subunit beta n=1 Tax=Citrullus colocynthis TaxID=252529 RepID=A0ABP0Y747_9ROSI